MHVCGSVSLSPFSHSLNINATSNLKTHASFPIPVRQISHPPTMSEEQRHQKPPPADDPWPEELQLPQVLMSDAARSLHATIEQEWDFLRRSACQTAAGRALWSHVVRDPVAAVLAGESYLRTLFEKMKQDKLNNAREISGVILAVRTLWFDSRLEAAINSFTDGSAAQVVLLGAGMDARAYRLGCLRESVVFEVDFPEVLQIKDSLLREVMASASDRQIAVISKSLIRVPADLREGDWIEKLQRSGYVPERNTVWVLEGILYYLPHLHAMRVLEAIAASCTLTRSVLLADFMNKSSISLSNSSFHFYSDWPDHLLPTLGYCHVKLSQIGDPDAHFGLLHDPQNLFNKLRSLPRSIEIHPEDGTPCRRLYLVEASGWQEQGE